MSTRRFCAKTTTATLCMIFCLSVSFRSVFCSIKLFTCREDNCCSLPLPPPMSMFAAGTPRSIRNCSAQNARRWASAELNLAAPRLSVCPITKRCASSLSCKYCLKSVAKESRVAFWLSLSPPAGFSSRGYSGGKKTLCSARRCSRRACSGEGVHADGGVTALQCDYIGVPPSHIPLLWTLPPALEGERKFGVWMSSGYGSLHNSGGTAQKEREESLDAHGTAIIGDPNNRHKIGPSCTVQLALLPNASCRARQRDWKGRANQAQGCGRQGAGPRRRRPPRAESLVTDWRENRSGKPSVWQAYSRRKNQVHPHRQDVRLVP